MGSIERFLRILIEHYGEAFPPWLAPVQAVVMAITDHQREFVTQVMAQMKAAGFRVESDIRNEKIGLKIREAEKAKIPFMFVVGDREVQSRHCPWRSQRCQPRNYDRRRRVGSAQD